MQNQGNNQDLVRIDISAQGQNVDTNKIAALIARTLSTGLPGQDVQVLSQDQNFQASFESLDNNIDVGKIVVVADKNTQFKDPSQLQNAQSFSLSGGQLGQHQNQSTRLGSQSTRTQ